LPTSGLDPWSFRRPTSSLFDPTPAQQRALASHCGAAWFAYNWGLALVKDRLDRRAAGQEAEVPWTLYALRREWDRAKHQRDDSPSREHRGDGVQAGLQRQRRVAALPGWAGWGQVRQAGGQPGQHLDGQRRTRAV